ncbi:MAG: hypothetical protein AB7S77_18575 [Desulfatirhabdiaceae bacterium]
MGISPSDNPIDDTRTLIKKIITQSKIPLSLDDIHKRLPVLYQTDHQNLNRLIETLIRDNAIHPWPARSRNRKPRFWNQDMILFTRQEILSALSKSRRTQNQLTDSVRKRLFGCAKDASIKQIKQILNDLLAEKQVFSHPPIGRKKTRFALQAVRVGDYLGKLLTEMERTCRNLETAHVTPAQVVAELQKKLGLSPDVRPQPQSVSQPLSNSSQPDFSQQMLQKMIEIEPGAPNQVPVWIPDLRKVMHLNKHEFDQAVLKLAGDGKIYLDRHAHPAQLSPTEREQMVTDHTDACYVVAVMRKGVL